MRPGQVVAIIACVLGTLWLASTGTWGQFAAVGIVLLALGEGVSAWRRRAV